MQQVFTRCQALHDAPLEEKAVPYFTDAAVLLPAIGYPLTLILGPGEPSMAHKVDEYCEVDKLHQCVKLYAGLIEDWTAMHAPMND